MRKHHILMLSLVGVMTLSLWCVRLFVWAADLAQVTPSAPAESQLIPTNTPTTAPTPHPRATLTPRTISAPSPSPTPPATATPSPIPTRVVLLKDTLPTAIPSPSLTLTATNTPPATILQADRYILVNQDRQLMQVFEQGHLLKEIPVSTGRPVTNAFTPAWTGVVGKYWGYSGFVDGRLVADYIWYLFPGPEGSILIHSVPYLLEDGKKQYNQLEALGQTPVSNGCVRISPDDAKWLKGWNPSGVPIEISKLNSKIQQAED